jgi:amino acid adenylation domain-containing protein
MAQYQAEVQLHSYMSILNTFFRQPQQQLSSIRAVSEFELDVIWNWTTPVAPTLSKCMHDIIHEKVQIHPEKNAIEAWDGSLTYAEVERYSSDLARDLRHRYDSTEQIIPVLFEKSRWTVVAVLAIMKSGCCFALLDPAQPEGRLRSIAKQINAKLLISSETQATLAARVAPNATIVPLSETHLAELYHPFTEKQPRSSLLDVSPSTPLYIQFTSGSTGLPKGCIITHCQYTSGAIPRAAEVGYHSNSRVLDFASYAFDVCIDSMLCTLAHGGTLCTPSEERRMNDLSGAMREMRVTLAGMTPSVVRTLDPDILPSLESLPIGGEGVSASDARAWRKSTKVVNCYGPSECTVGATYNNDVGSRPYISMGSGKGCSVWIVDPADHNTLVPPGAVGELLIEGPIVGNGYLNNPAKTKEVFIEDPAFLLAGSKSTSGRRGRLYKTGDLVRYDPDGHGEVVFVGRQDQQVKLRGQRIELAEIEYNMGKHLPLDVQLAVEVIKPGGVGEATLVAFLVEQKNSGMRHLDGTVFASFTKRFQELIQQMKMQLSEDLPSYMVPTAYIPLWKMPLLVSCKTDRKRLREIGTSIARKDLRRFSTTVSDETEPTSELEPQVARLWAKILGGDVDFSSNDNFFNMGGDSLRAMRLVAAAREDGIVMSVPDIMLNPTLSAMANKAKTLEGDGTTDVPAFSLLPDNWENQNVKIDVAKLCDADVPSIEDVYPCTPLQEGLMALSAKFADAYVAQRVVELPLEAARILMRAFEKVSSDCPILRTRIVNVPSRGLFQVVLRDGHLLRDHGSYLDEYLEIDRKEPMSLGKALFRYGMVHNKGNENAYIVITMHHAVYDGWSMPLVLERVNSVYNGNNIIRPVTFKHFISYLAQLDPRVSEKYWHERLDGVSTHQFPPLPEKGYITQADSLLEHYITVPATAHSKLTLATIIRGAWALVSALYMDQADIVFGETLTGRSASVPGIEQIEGPMITTVPFRIQLDFGRSISEFLQDVHAQTVQQISHEHLGLQNIRRLSRSARNACDLRTGIVLHPKEVEPPGSEEDKKEKPANGFLPSDDSEAAREALKFNTYALMLVCTLDENGFLVMASFDSKCVSSQIMERVLKVLDRIVTSFLGNPESKLGDLAVLDADEAEDAAAMRPPDEMVDSMEPIQLNDHTKKDVAEEKMSTPNEERLRSLLSRILSLPETDINSDDSFFELGGDSISAMRLVAEARTIGARITVAQIFQSPSFSALAACMGNEREYKLIDLLGRILNISKQDISAKDSFFELGGDSIGAMRLVAEARAEGLVITVAQIFSSKSLSELASWADETTSREQKPEAYAPFAAMGADTHLFSADRIQPLLEDASLDIADIYPARPLQQVAVEGTVNLPRYSLRYELIKFEAAIDHTRLAQSCQELIARNEVLRTVFIQTEGRCLGVVLSSLQVPYEEIAVPKGLEVDSFAQGYIHRDIQAPKPYRSSFVAFTLFVASDGVPTLSFRISHAQYDEICLPLVFQQLVALYAGTTVPETFPFSRHVKHVVGQNIPQSVSYWRNLLANSQMSVFKPNIPLTTRESTSFYREFDISSRPKDITIGSLPTAAWAITLARRLGVQDVVFGEVVTGRNIGVESGDRIFGPTWQYIPFRVPFSPDWTYLDLLHFVQAQHTTSSSYEGMGLGEIVEQCTDWNSKEVDWFDSVVHQAPKDWIEELTFGETRAKFETLYPHAEPLREWKCQAFVLEGGKKLGIEIVTFEEWKSVGEEVIIEVGEVLKALVRKSEAAIDLGGIVTDDVVNDNGTDRNTGQGEREVDEQSGGHLEDFVGVM